MCDRCGSKGRRVAKGVSKAGFDVLNDVVVERGLVSFGDDATNRSIIEDIQDDGTCWCGVTVWQQKTAMRISVCNWSTTEHDVDRSLGAILAIAQRHKNREKDRRG